MSLYVVVISDNNFINDIHKENIEGRKTASGSKRQKFKQNYINYIPSKNNVAKTFEIKDLGKIYHH